MMNDDDDDDVQRIQIIPQFSLKNYLCFCNLPTLPPRELYN